jgi:hypothetical protein
MIYEQHTTDPGSTPLSHPLDLDPRSADEELDLDPALDAAEAPPLPDIDRLNSVYKICADYMHTIGVFLTASHLSRMVAKFTLKPALNCVQVKDKRGVKP